MKRAFSILAGLIAAVFLFAASCSKPPGQAEYDRGLYELKRDNAVRARAMFERSIARRPGSDGNALAYNYLGVAAWKLGQYRTAQEAFEDSRRLNPTLVEPVYNLALLYRHQGNEARAIQLLQDAAKIDERDPRPLEYLGQLFIEGQQWSAARRALYAALNRAPDSARILTALAVVDLYQNGPEKSVESHLIALEKDSRYAPALFNVGLIYQTRLRDAERAKAYFKRYLAQEKSGSAADFARAALEPKHTGSAPTPAPLTAPAESDSARVSSVTPAPDVAAPSAPASASRPAKQTAAAIIKQATATAERGDARSALDQLLSAAKEAGRDKRTGDQEELLRASTRIAFEEVDGYLELGHFLMDRQDFTSALRIYKQAVALDARSFDSQFSMARAALKSGEVDTALVGLTAAVRLNPQSVDAQWELARVLDWQVQSPERAIQAYREFEKRFPGDPRARLIPERIKVLTPLARAAAQAPAPKPSTAPQIPTPPPEIGPVPRPKPVDDALLQTVTSASAPQPSARVAPASSPAPEPRAAPAPRVPERPSKPLPDLGLRPMPARNASAATDAHNRGTTLLKQRQYNDAISAFRRALEYDNRSSLSAYNLGVAYTHVGNYEMAKSAYAHALAAQPDLNGARYNLALLYFQSGDRASAAALAQELVKRDPSGAAGHYLLGQIYSERPETLPDARAAYSRYLDLAPNDPAAEAVRSWLTTH